MAYLIDAGRTPSGRFRGALSGVRTDDLAAIIELLGRYPDLEVDDDGASVIQSTADTLAIEPLGRIATSASARRATVNLRRHHLRPRGVGQAVVVHVG